MLEYLIKECNADVNAVNGRGNNAMHCTVINGNIEALKYLIEECKADVNIVDGHGDNVLHNAAMRGHIEIVKYLIEELNADISAVNDMGSNALHCATMGGELEIIRYLIEKCKADINKSDNEKMNILHYAVLGDQLEIVRYLIDKYNADINVNNPEQLLQWGTFNKDNRENYVKICILILNATSSMKKAIKIIENYDQLINQYNDDDNKPDSKIITAIMDNELTQQPSVELKNFPFKLLHLYQFYNDIVHNDKLEQYKSDKCLVIKGVCKELNKESIFPEEILLKICSYIDLLKIGHHKIGNPASESKIPYSIEPTGITVHEHHEGIDS